MAKQRLTKEQWRELIGRQARSGLRVAAFCQDEGIAKSTFFAKRWQLRASPRFVEVIADAAGTAERDALRGRGSDGCAGREPICLKHLPREGEGRGALGLARALPAARRSGAFDAGLRSLAATRGGRGFVVSAFGLRKLRALDAQAAARIWLCTGKTNIRCRFDGLAATA